MTYRWWHWTADPVRDLEDLTRNIGDPPTIRIKRIDEDTVEACWGDTDGYGPAHRRRFERDRDETIDEAARRAADAVFASMDAEIGEFWAEDAA